MLVLRLLGGLAGAAGLGRRLLADSRRLVRCSLGKCLGLFAEQIRRYNLGEIGPGFLRLFLRFFILFLVFCRFKVFLYCLFLFVYLDQSNENLYSLYKTILLEFLNH